MRHQSRDQGLDGFGPYIDPAGFGPFIDPQG